MTSTKQFQCTECLSVFPTLKAASKCHYGIGGVKEMGEPTYEDWKAFAKVRADAFEALGDLGKIEFNTAYVAGQAGAR